MPDQPDWMIYGANGYTGRLIAREAVRRGMRPALAGRSLAAIEPVARELNCDFRIFALDDPAEVATQVAGMSLVLHCAGPFSRTAAPMMLACLKAGVHYLDITGEIDVIEAAAALDGRAREAGVLLMPAVGFDVVPSDCLAATVAAALPGATHLELAFAGLGSISPGTAKTMVEGLPHGGRMRVDGRIIRVPAAARTMSVPFASGRRQAMSIPWGDVASAFYTTGIPNIATFVAVPPRQIRGLQMARWLMPLAGLGFVQRFLKRRIEKTLAGPDPAELAASRSSLWARATDAQGRSVEATLEAPGGYPLTVSTALAVVERVLCGTAPRGFSTPAKAFGKEFILEIPGTELRMS